MLAQLDTFLAFAAVMLGLSLLITAITQLITSLANARGKNLVALERLEALGPNGWRAAWVAARGAESKQKTLLWDALQVGGKNALEAKGALLPLLFKAEWERNRLVGQVQEWFGSAMDRASQLFASHARWLTVGCAVLLALLGRIDSFALLKQLSSDPALRGRIVAQVDNLTKKDPGGTPASGPEVDTRLAEINAITTKLDGMGVRVVPQTWTRPTIKEVPGILTTIILLTLGAPFWFNLLRNLSNLRPTVAALEHDERKERKAKEAA
jgi:hypothetical protein